VSVRIFLPFYGTRNFITVFITARHWALVWADESSPHLLTLFHLRWILISSHLCLGLPSGLFLSCFENKCCMHYYHSSTCYIPTPLILHVIALIILVMRVRIQDKLNSYSFLSSAYLSHQIETFSYNTLIGFRRTSCCIWKFAYNSDIQLISNSRTWISVKPAYNGIPVRPEYSSASYIFRFNTDSSFPDVNYFTNRPTSFIYLWRESWVKNFISFFLSFLPSVPSLLVYGTSFKYYKGLHTLPEYFQFRWYEHSFCDKCHKQITERNYMNRVQ